MTTSGARPVLLSWLCSLFLAYGDRLIGRTRARVSGTKRALDGMQV